MKALISGLFLLQLAGFGGIICIEMMTYKVIIFDLGNVVVNFNMDASSAKIAALSGYPKNEIFKIFFDSDISRRHEIGELSGLEFYNEIKGRFDLNLTFGEFKAVWNDIFWENEPVCDLVRMLKKKYKILLLSNVGQLHFEYIDSKFRIMREFDEKITSYALGLRKPDEKIYRYAIERARARPDEIIYIDDRKELVSEAKKLGIVSIAFTNTAELVENLTELGLDLNISEYARMKQG